MLSTRLTSALPISRESGFRSSRRFLVALFASSAALSRALLSSRVTCALRAGERQSECDANEGHFARLALHTLGRESRACNVYVPAPCTPSLPPAARHSPFLAFFNKRACRLHPHVRCRENFPFSSLFGVLSLPFDIVRELIFQKGSLSCFYNCKFVV